MRFNSTYTYSTSILILRKRSQLNTDTILTHRSSLPRNNQFTKALRKSARGVLYWWFSIGQKHSGPDCLFVCYAQIWSQKHRQIEHKEKGDTRFIIVRHTNVYIFSSSTPPQLVCFQYIQSVSTRNVHFKLRHRRLTNCILHVSSRWLTV